MSLNRPSRRDFLKASAVAATAAGAMNIARSAHAFGGDTIKIALVGCGGRGTGAAANCLNVQKILNNKYHVKLVALADAFEDRAKGAASYLKKDYAEQIDLPDERIFVGLDAYKKAIHDAGADMVLLCTPPGFRPTHYAEAVKAGRHVFMEKPCCTDAPGYRSLVKSNEEADAKNLKVVVGLQRHHEASYIKGVEEIHEGKLGDIIFQRVYWNGSGGGGHDIGKREPNQKNEMEFQIRNWGCFVWLYGDNICEQHVHNIDIANWVMRKDGDTKKAHPVEANGMGGRNPKGNYGDIFDNHFVEYTYADGAKVFSQCRHTQGCWGNVSEHAHGTKGNRGVPVGGGPQLESGNPYDQEHVDLIKAIFNDTKLNDGWHGAISSMSAVLGRMATYSGQVVKWDDAVANGPDESPEKLAWDAQPRHVPDANGLYPFATPGVYKPY